jgi:hypothetical protein
MEEREGGWTPSFLQAFRRLPRATACDAGGILQSLVDGINRPTAETESVASYRFLAGDQELCILVGLGSSSDDQCCIGLDVFVVGDASAAGGTVPIERERIDRAHAEWEQWLRTRRCGMH